MFSWCRCSLFKVCSRLTGRHVPQWLLAAVVVVHRRQEPFQTFNSSSLSFCILYLIFCNLHFLLAFVLEVLCRLKEIRFKFWPKSGQNGLCCSSYWSTPLAAAAAQNPPAGKMQLVGASISSINNQHLNHHPQNLHQNQHIITLAGCILLHFSNNSLPYRHCVVCTVCTTFQLFKRPHSKAAQ